MREYRGYHAWLIETSGQQQWAVWQYLSGKFRNTVEMTKTTQRRIVVQSLSRVRLFCSPVDCSLPGSSVHGISQARILELVAVFFTQLRINWGISSELVLAKESVTITCVKDRQGNEKAWLKKKTILGLLWLDIASIKKLKINRLPRSGVWGVYLVFSDWSWVGNRTGEKIRNWQSLTWSSSDLSGSVPAEVVVWLPRLIALQVVGLSSLSLMV